MALDACPGILALHPAADGLVARVRLPGGYATRPRWRALARLSRDFGDGRIDLTARGNVQLRGLRHDDADALAARAARAGLLPSLDHDRARNLCASPLAGLSGRPSLRALVTALDRAMLARPDLAALPGRFLLSLDDGTGGAALSACDLGLRARPGHDRADGPVGSQQDDIGGASPGPRGPAARAWPEPEQVGRPARAASDPGPLARPAPEFDLVVAGRLTGVRVPAQRAVRVLLAAATAAVASGIGTSVTRIADLPDGGESIAVAAGGTLGEPVASDTRLLLGTLLPGTGWPAARTRPGSPARLPGGTGPPIADPPGTGAPAPPTPRVGPATAEQAAPRIGAVVVAAPLSRLTGAQIAVVTGLAAAREVIRAGLAGRLVIPVAGDAGAARDALAGAGLIVAADDPMAGVTACSGSACARSVADVRQDARAVTHHGRTHWAGCARACGCPPDAEKVIALDATRYRLGEEVLA